MSEQYQCSDDELGTLLHRLLIVEDNPEVVIQHPTEGDVVYTRESYLALLDNLQKVSDMSPAQRYQEAKRLERKKQMQFRTAMIEARIEKVDLSDDGNFGKNTDGKDIGMEGMIFVPISHYLKGMNILQAEVGAFVDDTMRRAPIRIVGA